MSDQEALPRPARVVRCRGGGEHAGGRTATAEAQDPLHHGRRYWLDAAENLPSRLDGGETPNIDHIGQEGAIFMDYVAMQSCTSGRNAFFTGIVSGAHRHGRAEIPGSRSYLRPGTPSLAKFQLDLGYNTGEFGKNHLGDHTATLPTAHGFQEYWGYLYHLDAMQQVGFPDINKTPTEQAIVAPCGNTPVPGLPESPAPWTPRQRAA